MIIKRYLLSGLLVLCLWTAANSQAIRNSIPDVARPLPLSSVRITGGPLKHAQDLDREYLLRLEPDRMMAYYRKRAGLEPKAQGYPGWDGDGRNLTGHIAGHYLSAVSLMFAATGDARFKERADYLVKEMKEVQDKNGDGYLGAVEGLPEKFNEVANGNIKSSFFDLNGLWSPWYTLHKTYAGLRDAYRYTGNRTALELEIKYAAWTEKLLTRMTPAQTQQMLNTEFGGMNEVLADLYADTGDKRWLDLSHHFDHEAFLAPLKRREDKLDGQHGNTNVPKMLGVLKQYIYGGEKDYGVAAEFFWDAVVYHHTYATGGHGKDEYFGPPDQLANRVDDRTNESCNVYNMLKMTRRLFAIHPDIKYAEFEERALFNHVLASIDPEDGRTCYMVPIGQGVRHEYQDMFRGFTCCVGSGMESHGLHGDGIYYESDDKFWVNLFVPSTAKWQAAGAAVTMDTTFPDGDWATLKFAMRRPKAFTLLLRRPSWAGEDFVLFVNGKPLSNLPPPGSYVELKRTWKTGDILLVKAPKTLRVEGLPDNRNRAALMWGPLVLAADLGEERRGGPMESIPAFVTDARPIAEWLKPVLGMAGEFHAEGRGLDDLPVDVKFVPFYRLHRRQYSVYWDLYTHETWARKLSEVAAEKAKESGLEAVTVAFYQPGDAEKDKAFNPQGEEIRHDRDFPRPGVRAKKWFSFELPVDAAQPDWLVVTYHSEERAKRTFEILIEGKRVGDGTIPRSPPGSASGKFYDISYPIPADVTKDKKKLTVKFQATNGDETATVFGVRLVRNAEGK